jgi:hypothetical protein
MKYIDAEKIYKQVDGLLAHFVELRDKINPCDKYLSSFYQGKAKMCCQLLDIINSLQQEQSDVNLEEEIDMYVDGWRESGNEYFGLVNDEGWSVTVEDIRNVARHFYGLGLNARKEE